MEFLVKLEKLVAGWAKKVPHLPTAGQKWLADNVWWIVLIGAILSGIGLLFAIGGLFVLISLFGAVSAAYYAPYAAVGITGITILAAVISLVFLAARVVLMGSAIKPLKEKQKKGWVLLFIVWLLQAVAIVIDAVLSLSVVGFFMTILFGAIALAVTGYFLFEIHAQFGGAPKAAKKKTTKAKKA